MRRDGGKDVTISDIESGSECVDGHPLYLVAEGYAFCSLTLRGFDPLARGSLQLVERHYYYAWRFTPPALGGSWASSTIKGRNGERIEAWVWRRAQSKDEILAIIQADIDQYRANPLSEEQERARLMPV